LGELVTVLWDEAILSMQEWVLGESFATILQVIVALFCVGYPRTAENSFDPP